MCRRLLFLSCALWCLSFVASLWGETSLAKAASLYDPQIEYRTVTSPRFAVHYPKGAFNLAVRVSRLAEEILRRDAKLLGFMPQGTIDIVLTDMQDDANGSAEVIPHNTVRLQLAAPTELTGLASYDDWLTILLTHELSHIVDIDHTRGPTRVLRYIFGKLISFNGTVPQYLSEGVAVYTETKLTPFGRGRSSYVDMVLRMAALEKTFIHLDQAHVLFARYPYGNAAYFYGGRFHLYLSERLGEDAVARLHAYYASQPIPWIYSPGARAVFGAPLDVLWNDFRSMESRVAEETAARVIAQGVTASTELFSHEGDILGARYSRDGNQVIYSRRSPYDGSTTRRVHRLRADKPPTDERLFRDTASPRFSLDPHHGDDFIYSMASITHRFDTFNDLFVYDAAKKRRIRLRDHEHKKRPLRARDPSLSPDGNTLVFVRNELQQSYLVRAQLHRERGGRLAPDMQLRTLVGPAGEMQQASPAFSPDGALIAASTWFAGGTRDIVLLDAQTGALVRRITFDTAQDGNPVFSPDGRYVLYESDASGISNIYAQELATNESFQVTNVIGGAFQADVSSDGRWLLFRQAKGGGFAVHEMAFSPNAWRPVCYDPNKGYLDRPQAGCPSTAEMQRTPSEIQEGHSYGLASPTEAWMLQPWPASSSRAQEPVLSLAAQESEGPYGPLRGLLPWGDNWLLIPNIGWYNNTAELSVATMASDSLRRHTWILSAGGLYGVNRPLLSLSYANDVLLPTLSATGAYTSTLYRASTGKIVESSTTGNVSAVWPWGRRHAVSLGYGFEYRQIQGGQGLNLPFGRFANVSASYRYGFSRAFPYSISNETGKSVGVGVQAFSRALGGQYDQFTLNVDARGFLNNPLFHNHVLAVRLVGSWAFGRDAVQKFFLYGTQANSFFTTQSSRLFALRGFFPGTPLGAPTPGAGVAALYAEYRFPLWHVQRGIFSWPVFFDHLHMALFADTGNTFGPSTQNRGASSIDATAVDMLRHLWVSAGAEVRLDLTLAWAVPLTVRAGLAEPMLARGLRVVDRTGPRFYLNVGTLY